MLINYQVSKAKRSHATYLKLTDHKKEDGGAHVLEKNINYSALRNILQI